MSHEWKQGNDIVDNQWSHDRPPNGILESACHDAWRVTPRVADRSCGIGPEPCNDSFQRD
jgi:hypothetical protein